MSAAFPGTVEQLVEEMVSAVHHEVTLWGGYRELTRRALYRYAAELAQLRAALADAYDETRIGFLSRENDTLRKQLAEARADGERLDWLAANSATLDWCGYIERGNYDKRAVRVNWLNTTGDEYTSDEFAGVRAAIDHTRRAQGGSDESV